jgi:hypothetical protein
MTFRDVPASAAWQHQTARTGFEAVFLRVDRGSIVCNGSTTAVEDGLPWIVEYAVELDARWCTRKAHVRARAGTGELRETTLTSDGQGRWRVNDQAASHLEGCLDVDLESSAFTNAFPIHRLALAVGSTASAPAAYVRAMNLSAERLEQRYTRVADRGACACFDYAAASFGFECRLVYDEAGLVLEYPGIALRII